MSTRAKKIAIGVGIAAAVVAVGLVLLVIFFPAGLVKDRAVAAMEARLGRPVSVGDVGLKLFPSIGAQLTDLRIGDRAEPGRPRIAADAIRMNVRLWPLLRRQVEITSVEIEGLDVRAQMGNGKRTQAVAKGKEDVEAPAPDSARTMYFLVEKMSLKDCRVSVLTETGAPLIELGGISEELSADATSAGDLHLEGRTAVDSVRVYLPSGELGQGMRIRLDKSLRYDRSSDSLLVESANLDLSGLPVAIRGAAAGMTSGRPTIDLKLEGGPGEVSDVLGYLPSNMFPQMKGIKSKGRVSVKGSVRGPVGGADASTGEKGALDYRLSLTMSEGSIVHPELPDPIENIAFAATLTPESVDISNLSMKSGNSSVNARGNVSSYKDDPKVDANVDLDVDLQKYSALRGDQDDTELAGRASGKLSVQGKVKDLNQLKLAGAFDLSSVSVSSKGMQHPLEEVNGRITLSGSDITLQRLSAKMGSSDFTAQGSLRNYKALIPESGAGAPARVDLTVRSDMLALDELTSGDDEKKSNAEEAGEPSGTPPEKTAALLSSLTGTIDISAGHVRTKETEMRSARGLATVDRGLIRIERLDVEIFGGTGAVQGTVDYRQPSEAKLDLKLQVQKAEISNLLASSKSLNSFSRMAGFLTGRMDANATLKGGLSETSGLDLSSISSVGDLSLQGAEIVNHPIQTSLVNYLDVKELKTLAISEWFQPFRIENGRLYVEKLSIKTDQIELSANGWQGLDGKVEMNFDILLPRELSAGLRRRVPNELAPVLFDDAESRILAPVRVTGSYDSPSVALDTAQLTSKAQEQAKKRLAEERNKLEEEAKKKARGFLNGLLKTGVKKTDKGEADADTTKGN